MGSNQVLVRNKHSSTKVLISITHTSIGEYIMPLLTIKVNFLTTSKIPNANVKLKKVWLFAIDTQYDVEQLCNDANLGTPVANM